MNKNIYSIIRAVLAVIFLITAVFSFCSDDPASGVTMAMFTCVAFSESIDPAAAWVNITAVPDQHVKTAGDYIYVPPNNNLLMGGMACLEATVAPRARVRTPLLNSINPSHIVPANFGLYPDAEYFHGVSRNNRFPLAVSEGMDAQINSNPAAAAQQSVVIWLSDGNIDVIQGAIVTVEFTITLALVAGSWEYSEITLVDELPVGTFDVVGMRNVIDTAVVARFVPLGGNHRPGAPCSATKEYGADQTFRFGNLGTWFSFDTNNLPGVEVMSSAAAASATYTCYMDVIKR